MLQTYLPSIKLDRSINVILSSRKSRPCQPVKIKHRIILNEISNASHEVANNPILSDNFVVRTINEADKRLFELDKLQSILKEVVDKDNYLRKKRVDSWTSIVLDILENQNSKTLELISTQVRSINTRRATFSKYQNTPRAKVASRETARTQLQATASLEKTDDILGQRVNAIQNIVSTIQTHVEQHDELVGRIDQNAREAFTSTKHGSSNLKVLNEGLQSIDNFDAFCLVIYTVTNVIASLKIARCNLFIRILSAFLLTFWVVVRVINIYRYGAL